MSYADTFADAGSKILQKEFKVVRSIYVDLEFLQDLRFGSILTHVSSPDELEYLYSQIDVYNGRYDENTPAYFPEFNITNEVINNDLKDPSKINIIATISPMTSMFYNFNTLLGMYTRSNKYTVEGDSTISVYVGVDNQLYPDQLLRTFKQSIETQFQDKVKVSFIKSRRYSAEIDFYASMDILFLYDLEGFINNSPAMANAFAGEGMFAEKAIFAKPQINEKFSGLSARDKEQGVDKMRDQLNLYCDFEYAPSEIVIFNNQQQEGGN